MSHSTECPCGRPRVGCDYHDPALQPRARGRTAGSVTQDERDAFRRWATANWHAWYQDCKQRKWVGGFFRDDAIADVIAEYLNERKGPWAVQPEALP